MKKKYIEHWGGLDQWSPMTRTMLILGKDPTEHGDKEQKIFDAIKSNTSSADSETNKILTKKFKRIYTTMLSRNTNRQDLGHSDHVTLNGEDYHIEHPYVLIKDAYTRGLIATESELYSIVNARYKRETKYFDLVSQENKTTNIREHKIEEKYKINPDDFVFLTIEYSKYETQQILTEAIKGKIILVCVDNEEGGHHAIYQHVKPGDINRMKSDILQDKIPLDFPKGRKQLVGITDLLVSKVQADSLSSIITIKSKLRNTCDTPPAHSIKSRAREDAISNAVIDYILPKILPDKTKALEHKDPWIAFTMLEDVLKKQGAKITFTKPKNKLHSLIAGTGKHDEDIDTTFKAFEKRLKNLVKVYKTKSQE